GKARVVESYRAVDERVEIDLHALVLGIELDTNDVAEVPGHMNDVDPRLNGDPTGTASKSKRLWLRLRDDLVDRQPGQVGGGVGESTDDSRDVIDVDGPFPNVLHGDPGVCHVEILVIRSEVEPHWKACRDRQSCRHEVGRAQRIGDDADVASCFVIA